MTTLRSLLNPGYEPGDGNMDGAQLVDGQWWHPVFGCDSLKYVVDNARQALAPEVAIPAGPSPKDWADKFNKFDPKPPIDPMTFDPDTIKLPEEFHERMGNAQWSSRQREILAARQGAAQAVEALRHQWPEPLTRQVTKADADDDGAVQWQEKGRWTYCHWRDIAEKYEYANKVPWLHTPNWRPKPKPTEKEQALKLMEKVGRELEDPEYALLYRIVQSAPDTTP